VFANGSHDTSGGLHNGHECVGNAGYQFFLHNRLRCNGLDQTRDLRDSYDPTVRRITKVDLSSVHKEMMGTERKEIDARNYYEFVSRRIEGFKNVLRLYG